MDDIVIKSFNFYEWTLNKPLLILNFGQEYGFYYAHLMIHHFKPITLKDSSK